MKNIITKIIIILIIIAAIFIGLKVGNNALGKANASNNAVSSTICGVNNGWIWNGTQCVNTCDANHPWDPIQKRCSTGYGYNTGYTSTLSCTAAYGANYYFDGKTCVERVTKPNANYYGNPYNGGTTNPVYSNTNTNTNQNYYPNYPNINSEIIYQNSWDNIYYPGSYPRENADYYIYIITETTSYPNGTPIYFGNEGSYNYYNNSYNNPTYYYSGNNSNTSYYNYTDYYSDYYSNYYNNSYYSSGYYTDSVITLGSSTNNKNPVITLGPSVNNKNPVITLGQIPNTNTNIIYSSISY